MKEKKNYIIIAAGGSGGHLLPAQQFSKELQKLLVNHELLFMAHGLAANPRFEKSEFPYRDIPSSQLPKSLIQLPKACFVLALGVMKSVRHFLKERPRAVVGFGSYHTFPVLLAAAILRIPIVLHVADSIPGKVNRLFSRVASWCCLFFPTAQEGIKCATAMARLPLRDALFQPVDSLAAYEYFGLSNQKKTLLVFGGSQGAKRLNEMIPESIFRLPEEEREKLQVIHFTGSQGAASDLQEKYESFKVKACVKSYEAEMHYAWTIADGVIARAGASSIAEQLAFKVPAIYIPLPHAADNHQMINAQIIEKQLGGAITCDERKLDAHKLAAVLEDFLRTENLAHKKEALKNQARLFSEKKFSELFHLYIEKSVSQ